MFVINLCDISGNVLLNQTISSENNNKIDLGKFSGGVFLLQIVRINDWTKRSFKIIRID